MYTDNNPLKYVLTMAKPDAVSHWQVASLANYNFQLYNWEGNMNINADNLSRVSWLGRMPDNSGTHLQVTTVAVWPVQEASLECPTSSIEAYICDLHILDSVQDSQQVTCMTMEDWHQAQQADPTLSLVITRLWDGPWGDDSPNGQILLNSTSSCVNGITSYYEKVSYIGGPDPGDLRRPSFSWFCLLHTERSL